jgi:hemerythrin superfamily protein
MLRDEAINGVQPGKKSHYQKAVDRVREITKVLNKHQAPEDEEILKREKEKLEKAIKLWERKNGKK